MAFVTLKIYSKHRMYIFQNFEYYNNLIYEENFVILEGILNIKEEEQPKILVNVISPLLKIPENELKKQDTKEDKRLYIKIKNKKDWYLIERLKPVFKQYSGNIPVIIYIEESNEKLKAHKELWIRLEEELINKLFNFFGADNVKVI